MKRLASTWRELKQYPSAVIGLVIILALVSISIYTVITVPYSEAVRYGVEGKRSGTILQKSRGRHGPTFSGAPICLRRSP